MTHGTLRRLSICVALAVIMVGCSDSESESEGFASGYGLIAQLPMAVDDYAWTEVRDVAAARTGFGSEPVDVTDYSSDAWIASFSFDSWAAATDEEWIDGIGFGPGAVTWSAVGGAPPETYGVLVGDIDPDAVVAALRETSADLNVSERDGWMFVDLPGEELRPYVLSQKPMNGLGRALRYAVRPGVLVVATRDSVRAGVLDALEGTATGLGDAPGMATLVEHIEQRSPVFAGIVPQRGTALVELLPGLLSSASLVFDGSSQRLEVTFVFRDEASASEAADTIGGWIDSARVDPSRTVFPAEAWQTSTVEQQREVVTVAFPDGVELALVRGGGVVAVLACALNPEFEPCTRPVGG